MNDDARGKNSDAAGAFDRQQTLVKLSQEVEKINNHWLIRAHNSVLGLIWFNFLRGLFFGLGSFLGATLVVYILLQILANINFIPIIGNWATEIADIITNNVTEN